jgi:hypothetical protein
MKYLTLSFALFFTGILGAAAPLQVYVVGGIDKAISLFPKSAERFSFVTILKKDLIYPKPRIQTVIPIPKAIGDHISSNSALVALIIDSDGAVVAVAIAKSTSELLSKSIAENITQWEFVPAKKAGRPVATMVLAPLEFKVEPTSDFIKHLTNRANQSPEPPPSAVH